MPTVNSVTSWWWAKAHPTTIQPFTAHRSRLTAFSVALCLSLALASPSLDAQVAAKRLSEWLLEQPFSAEAYPLGLSWRVPDEVPSQNALRLDLLKSLSGLDRDVSADPEAVVRLRDWLRTLPVTGRVPVAVADARWLQANPARDPVLLPGHSVDLPQRPRTVMVITEQGRRCTVTHAPGHEARAYLEACNPAGAARTDWAWIAQPDGRVQRYGVAAWNREAQDVPAPGSWIWGPPRDSGWPERFSEKLISFLATQGPAPDAAATELPAEKEDRGESRRGSASEGFRFSDLTRETPKPSPGRKPGSSDPGISLDPGPGLERSGAGSLRDDTLRRDDDRGREGSPHSAVAELPSGTPSARSRGLEVTSSDWGNVGLLQTPSARMRSAGHLTFHYSSTRPYTHGNIFAQPFDWLEAGFRYTDVTNRLYGPPELSGDQSYKDKSFDAKIRLWPESAYIPQIVVGVRDLGGTGLFAAEYLVASKRTGALDWSLGAGWGYMAGQARERDIGTGGNLRFGEYFRGRAALFGGVQWQTPWQPLIVKLEYDGNNYQNEPQANNQRQTSPWNFGLVYRAARWADLTLGVERGNTLTLGLTLHTALDQHSLPKVSDPPRVPVAGLRPQQAPDWSVTARDIRQQTDWHVRNIEQRGNELRVVIDNAEAFYWRDRLDRITAVLHRDAPQAVDRFVLAYRERGIEVAEHVIDRNAWLAQLVQPLPPSVRRETVIARAAEETEPGEPAYEKAPPLLDTGFGVNYAQTLGGPDAFILYQIYAEGRAKLRLRDDTWAQGSLRFRLIDNYDKFKFTAPSNLPRVRTFLREYLTTSELTVQNLQLTHVGRLSENQYYSVYGGYLEEMFAGAGGEWLYRPFASRLAFGVDVNAVRQRDFHQDFAFLEPAYRTTTGHATLYWDTGWHGVEARLSAGRYLAGDSGVTLELVRFFKNGVAFGAFATKTNVSAEEFGEGSFDKGVFISIPFDAMFTRSTGSIANFVWKPLTRDGGAKLWRNVTLYNLTRARDDRTLKFEPAPQPNDAVLPADRREAWQPTVTGPEPYTRVTPRPAAAQWGPGTFQEHRLIEALYKQEFRNIKVAYDGSHRLTVTLANDRIHPVSRAVGRAARTALRLAPVETREIRIVFAERADPVVIYDFFDLGRLERYFSGAIKRSELAEYVAVEYLNPAAREKDPLARLDDLEPDAEPRIFARLVPETFSLGRVKADVVDAARTAADVNWLRAGAFGAGLVLASSALDRRAFDFAKDHAESRWVKGLTNVGDAIPWLGMAGAALAAFDGSDPVRSRTGYAAAEAGAAAFLVATGLKYAVGRARPEEGLGNSSFQYFTSDSRFNAFPSRHTAVAWAVATPFALEYDANWLYGVAALTNLGRIGSREHWVSDTVAGSLIGYGLGRIFWQSVRSPKKGEPRVMLAPSGINLAWELQ